MHYLGEILFYMFIIFGLINTLHLGFYVVGANIYDIRQLWRQRQRLGKVATLPAITVLIPAYNEELTIERCLDSIRETHYPELEVIVHNDQSSDSTAKLVRAYRKRYPDFKLRLVDRHRRSGKSGGLNYCLQRYVKSDLVMTLDADCVIKPDAIERAVSYFEDPKVVGVAANVRLMNERSVLGILQQFEHLIGYRSKKFYTLTNCEIIVGGVASTYRRETLAEAGNYNNDTQTEDIGLSMAIAALGNKSRRLIYASDVVAMTEGAHSYKALLKQRYRWKMGCLQNLLMYTKLTLIVSRRHSLSLTMYRLPMAFLSEVMLLLQPLILGYVIWLSVHYHATGLFLGAYLTITIYVLLTIWPDEHSSWAKKFSSSLYAPFMYFIFYIMETIQVVSIGRCLLNPKTVARKAETQQASWTPPARSGQEAGL